MRRTKNEEILLSALEKVIFSKDHSEWTGKDPKTFIQEIRKYCDLTKEAMRDAFNRLVKKDYLWYYMNYNTKKYLATYRQMLEN